MLVDVSAGQEVKRVAGEPSLLERLLFVAIMLLGIALTRVAAGEDSDSGSLPAEIVWAFAYLLAMVGIYAERETAYPLIRKSLPLLLIVGIAALSTLWSYDPALTLRRAFGLFGTTAIAFYLVSRYSLRAFLETLVLTINASAIISLFMVVVTPEYGLMQERYQGAWQGLFWEKNRLGGVMEIGIVTMLLMLPSTRGRYRIYLWCSVVLCAVLLGGSRSATPIVALLFVLLCLSVMFRLRRKKIGFAVTLVGSALVALAVCAHLVGYGPEDVLLLLGRDPTLTGRTEIWSYVIRYIEQKPVLGWGYQVFWEVDGPVRRYLMKDLGWEPVSAHNGFLEIALQFGLVGLAVFMAFLVEALRRTLRLFNSSDERLDAWPLLAVISLIVMNVADPTFAVYNELRWVVFVTAFLYATLGYHRKSTRDEFDHSEHLGFQAGWNGTPSNGTLR